MAIEEDKGRETLGRIPNFFLNQIRKGLTVILSKQNWKVYLDRLKQKIMAAADIGLDKAWIKLNPPQSGSKSQKN